MCTWKGFYRHVEVHVCGVWHAKGSYLGIRNSEMIEPIVQNSVTILELVWKIANILVLYSFLFIVYFLELYVKGKISSVKFLSSENNTFSFLTHVIYSLLWNVEHFRMNT